MIKFRFAIGNATNILFRVLRHAYKTVACCFLCIASSEQVTEVLYRVLLYVRALERTQARTQTGVSYEYFVLFFSVKRNADSTRQESYILLPYTIFVAQAFARLTVYWPQICPRPLCDVSEGMANPQQTKQTFPRRTYQ